MRSLRAPHVVGWGPNHQLPASLLHQGKDTGTQH